MTVFFIIDNATMRVIDICNDITVAVIKCDLYEANNIDARIAELDIHSVAELNSHINLLCQFANEWKLK